MEEYAGRERLTAAEASERATRRWLEEAWRHGEVVADEDRPCAVTPVRPVDAVLYSRAVPTLLPAGWSHEAVFGQLPQTATPAPLHFAWMVAALTLAAMLWRTGRGSGRERPS